MNREIREAKLLRERIVAIYAQRRAHLAALRKESGSNEARHPHTSRAVPDGATSHNGKVIRPFGGTEMSDDLKNPGAQDRARINTHEPHEVRYWTKELGVSEDELRRLVEEHGVSAERIRDAVSGRRKTA